MKKYAVHLIILLFIVFWMPIEGLTVTQAFVEGTFDNSYLPVDQSGAATGAIFLGSGGNAGAYPDGDGTVPMISGGAIQLRRSILGAVVAGKIGYPEGVANLFNAAQALMQTGVTYKTPVSLGGSGQTGSGELGSGAWDIRFPGVRGQETSELLPIDANGIVDGQNYFEQEIIKAAEHYRSILRIDPYNEEAAKGLLQTYYERMSAFIFAGNTAHVWAFRKRVVESNTLQDEINLFEEGIDFYKKAIAVFTELTQTMPDVTYFDGTADNFNHDELRLPDNGVDIAIAPKLLETYIRTIAFQAETTGIKAVRRYLNTFEYPILPIDYTPARQEIVAYINEQAALIQQEMLLANIYFNVFITSDPNVVTDIGRVAQIVSDLLIKRDYIRDGYLFFAIARSNQGSVTNKSSYGVYAPEFVPFLYKDADNSQNFSNSYQNLYVSAHEIATHARVWENEARHEDRAFDNNQNDLQNRLQNIRAQYFSELQQLCGQIRDKDGNLAPDIVYSLLPPQERLNGLNAYKYDQPGESYDCAINKQWEIIKTVDMEVEAARLDLKNLVKEMEKKEEVASKIVAGINNVALLILEDGKRLEALELRRGELIAAQIEYEDSKNSNFMGTILGIAARVVMAYFSAGTSEISGLGMAISTGLTVAQAYSQVASINSIAQSKSRTQQELARIEAQKQRIRAFESAQVQFQHRDEVLFKTEEQLHSMLLRAERLHLNILMTQQRANMERSELSRLYGRVAYLIQEFVRATYYVTHSPLNRPDFRLIRDIAMRDADEAFAYAKERCYLAAKAAEYRVNPNPNSMGNGINTAMKGIIKARRAYNLLNVLDILNGQIENLQLQQGARQSDSLTLSLRHYIFQNNYINEDDPNQSVYEPQLDENGNVINSDEAWKQFLQSHLIYDTDIGAYKLEFAFSTSLNRALTVAAPIDPNDPQITADNRKNPLHLPNTTGILISCIGEDHTEQNGLTVNIRGRQLSITSDDRVRATLRQEGSSAVRFGTWDQDPNKIRFWNLQPRDSNIVAAINGVVPQILANDDYRPSTPQFHERSPANDRWVLTIRQDSGWHANSQLLMQLDKITDIVITFDVTYFTP